MGRSLALALLTALAAAPLGAQGRLPALPDSAGWGVHILAAAQDHSGAVWLGTYGQGIFRLPADSSRWQRIRSDTNGTSISWDFVNAIAVGRGDERWGGRVGYGWGGSGELLFLEGDLARNRRLEVRPTGSTVATTLVVPFAARWLLIHRGE